MSTISRASAASSARSIWASTSSAAALSIGILLLLWRGGRRRARRHAGAGGVGPLVIAPRRGPRKRALCGYAPLPGGACPRRRRGRWRLHRMPRRLARAVDARRHRTERHRGVLAARPRWDRPDSPRLLRVERGL